MRWAVVGLMVAGLVGCGSSQSNPESNAPRSNVDLSSSIAGKTYRCTTEGPVSNLTFAKDGKISGELLNGPATGSWFSRGAIGVEIHVSTGVIAIRDVLKPRGGGWSGRNIRCS